MQCTNLKTWCNVMCFCINSRKTLSNEKIISSTNISCNIKIWPFFILERFSLKTDQVQSWRLILSDCIMCKNQLSAVAVSTVEVSSGITSNDFYHGNFCAFLNPPFRNVQFFTPYFIQLDSSPQLNHNEDVVSSCLRIQSK